MKNKLYILTLLVLALCCTMQSCSDDETYADKRKRENKQINAFIKSGVQVKSEDSDEYLLDIPGDMQIISENDFHNNDSTTDVSKNQYVYFKRTGVYMQILEKGTGEKLKSGETSRIVVRYTEFNIAGDSIQTSNRTVSTETKPDILSVTNTSGTFTGTFLSGVMYESYSSSAVPAAWLVPLTYINLGRVISSNSIAHVRLVVPASQGQANASANVYPCFYDIYYQRGR